MTTSTIERSTVSRESGRIAKTMKAALVREFGQALTIEERPVPVPAPGELLVEVIACGVCHTDLHAADGDWPVKPQPPFIPGHETAGRVVALGSGVDDFKLGDAVGIAWLHDACGKCEFCITGWETLCASQHDSGYSLDGGFAQYAIATAAYAARLPADVDFYQMAPILCAGVTTYKGIKQTEARPGEWIAISGLGGLGHVAVQFAKAMGLNVVGLDITEDKLALARSVGADVTVNALDADAAAQVIEATHGGAHGVLVTAVSPPAFSQAIALARSKGTVTLVGLPPGGFQTPIFDVVLKGLTIRGSIVGTRKDLSEAVAFATANKVRADIHKAKLEDINQIFADLKAGKVDGRMVLDLAR
jgi:alcohol dehydrogenase, propanol-preferring